MNARDMSALQSVPGWSLAPFEQDVLIDGHAYTLSNAAVHEVHNFLNRFKSFFGQYQIGHVRRFVFHAKVSKSGKIQHKDSVVEVLTTEGYSVKVSYRRYIMRRNVTRCFKAQEGEWRPACVLWSQIEEDIASQHS